MSEIIHTDPGPPQIGPTEPSKQQLPPPSQTRRHIPTTLELASHTSSSLITGLTGRSPFMLGVVVLNAIGIASAVYFLNLLIRGQQAHLNQLLSVQQVETQSLLKMHDREFDALMKINRDIAITLVPTKPPAVIAPPPEPQGPPIPENRP